uniref:Uncharacterized protein n=1 Tax=Arundo donax TaxID=35708 RepID=A0A0A9C1U4_ARUDO
MASCIRPDTRNVAMAATAFPVRPRTGS